MSDERMHVLKMISEGRITPEEGARLLEALGEGDAPNARKGRKGPDQGGGPIPPIPPLPTAEDVERIISGAMKQAKGAIGPALRDGLGSLKGLRSLRGIKTFIHTRYTGETKAVELEERVPVPTESEVRFQTLSGDITVRTYEGGILAVRAFGYAPMESGKWALSIDKSDDRITVRVDDAGDGFGLSEGMSFDVLLPIHCALTVGTVSGDIDVEGVERSLSLRNVSGDVTVRGCTGAMEISSTSGDVDVAAVINAPVTIESVSGDVRMRFDGIRGGCAVKTVSGDVTLAFPSSVGVAVECRTFSGSLDAPGFREVRTEGNLRVMGYGEPSAVVAVGTLSGDIVLSVE